MNWTKIAVLAFIVILLLASFNARSDQSTISLGHTVFNSTSTVAEYAYRKGDWEAGFTLIGEGDTKNGYVEGTSQIASISYLVEPDWNFLWGKNYYRLGGSYQHGNPLVGPTNFRLGVGMNWDVFSFEYAHYSSAGVHDNNTGIDMIQLRYQIPHD